MDKYRNSVLEAVAQTVELLNQLNTEETKTFFDLAESFGKVAELFPLFAKPTFNEYNKEHIKRVYTQAGNRSQEMETIIDIFNNLVEVEKLTFHNDKRVLVDNVKVNDDLTVYFLTVMGKLNRAFYAFQFGDKFYQCTDISRFEHTATKGYVAHMFPVGKLHPVDEALCSIRKINYNMEPDDERLRFWTHHHHYDDSYGIKRKLFKCGCSAASELKERPKGVTVHDVDLTVENRMDELHTLSFGTKHLSITKNFPFTTQWNGASGEVTIKFTKGTMPSLSFKNLGNPEKYCSVSCGISGKTKSFTLHKGPDFLETEDGRVKRYSDEHYYYPKWMTEDTVWINVGSSGSMSRSGNSYHNHYSNSVDVSDSDLVKKLLVLNDKAQEVIIKTNELALKGVNDDLEDLQGKLLLWLMDEHTELLEEIMNLVDTSKASDLHTTFRDFTSNSYFIDGKTAIVCDTYNDEQIFMAVDTSNKELVFHTGNKCTIQKYIDAFSLPVTYYDKKTVDDYDDSLLGSDNSLYSPRDTEVFKKFEENDDCVVKVFPKNAELDMGKFEGLFSNITYFTVKGKGSAEVDDTKEESNKTADLV